MVRNWALTAGELNMIHLLRIVRITTALLRNNVAAGFLAACCLMLPMAGGQCALGGDLAFGDPARLPPPPAGAVGYPSREANLDALPGFIKPPPGYGEVPFYWWLGDPLTKERLAWQLDQLAGKGIVGLQINYAHSDQGGQSWGLTYPSDPPLFSDAWWKLVEWFAAEAKKRGMAVSLSDYTLGIVGQGYWMDEILKEQPDLRGSVLEAAVRNVEGGKECSWEVPEGTVGVTIYRLEGDSIAAGSGVDLRPRLQGRTLRWQPPAGNWRVVAAFSRVVANSVDPLDPRLGPEVIKHFFQRFEDHLPGEGGKALNCFFSDELNFGIGGNLWHKRFAEEFRRRKGYDLVPELAAVFMDIGPRTPKVRLDYKDVMVALEEQSYFKPVFDWHYQRGMLYGGDHGGRGNNVTEFGDYFRTQRWMLGPGNDQPNFGRAVVQTKVHSSISHLYLRPRTWLEGYHSSGWGTTPEQLTQASVENYALGSNLQVLHGLYYSTHGGWWEWAPPCNHFRMPYWAHMETWTTWSQRLCYLLSQGVHRCDVAVMYPVTPMQAGMDGQNAVKNAFGLANHLFARGIDFDFIDDDSLARAKVEDKELRAAGEAYRVLVLPAMKAVRDATLRKAAEFKRAGGVVIALGAVPEASDRAGRNDAELKALVKETFPATTGNAAQVEEIIGRAFPRDFTGPGRVLHRKVGARDIYLVCGAPKNAECFFRAKGKVELWDPWTGTTQPLAVLEQSQQGTKLRMPLTEKEAQLIVFSPGTPLLKAAGEEKPVVSVELGGDWDFELKPTMDNRWGDFRWPPTPALIGAEARQFRYAEESPGKTTVGRDWMAVGFDDSKWTTTTCSFGPKFWKLGPLPDGVDSAALEAQLSALERIDPAAPVELGGRKYVWQPYDFSWRWGVEGDPGHQGYHGLKENVPDEFIALGRLQFTMTDSAYGKEQGGSRYYLWTSVPSPSDQQARLLIGGNRPASVWINRVRVDKSPGTVAIKAGSNPLLLRYDNVGRGFVVLDTARPDVPVNESAVAAASPMLKVSPLAMTWHGKPEVLPFDVRPQQARHVGWYRFTAPPGFRSMKFSAFGNIRAWADGKEMALALDRDREDGLRDFRAAVYQAEPGMVNVALRIEQQPGCYAGAAIPEPIALECRPGKAPLGDWSTMGVLAHYSGGAWYRKTVAFSPEQLQGRLLVQLGQVAATAEVRVNGQLAGIRVALPWTVDISKFAKPGENRIEILVYNTLANHYGTIPTRYRGSPLSGLLGPVRVESLPPATAIETR